MSYPNFQYGVSVTLVRRRTVSGHDEYNNDVYDEVPALVSGCAFHPSGSTEALQFTDQVDTTDTFFMPAGTDVVATDAIDFGGQRYEVTGDPSRWTSPFSGHSSPIRVDVTRIVGTSL